MRPGPHRNSPWRAAGPALLAALAALAMPASADDAAFYRLDPVHTRIVFEVDHAGFSRALGTFSGVEGELRFDPGDWAGASVAVRIPLARLDLGDPDWNRKVLDPAFLDAGDHPEAVFRSTRVEPVDAAHARITGLLSLRGVEREVVLDATLNRRARHPLTFRRTIGFSATAVLSRGDFGMDAWSRLVGDEVRLRIELEANRRRDPGPDGAGRPETAGEDGEDGEDGATEATGDGPATD